MKDDKLLVEAKARFRRAHDSEQYQRELCVSDLDFVGGLQWPETIAEQRERDGRPVLSINRLPALVAQAVTAARRSNMSIAVSPVEGGDEDLSEVYAGLIRQIERTSHADQAYDHGLQLAAECGVGYWRVTTQYDGDRSFDQALRIERIRSPFSVYIDPDAERYDKSDARWAFVTDYVLRDDLEDQYPSAKLSSFDSDGEDGEYWRDGDDRLRVAEYYWTETTTKTIVALSNGQVAELTDEIRALVDLDDGLEVLNSRDVEAKTVRWAKVCGACVLEGPQDWPGRYIPIVPCYGPESIVDGRVVYRSLIRYAKDPQKQYNYWQSALTEKIALAPKSPWLVTPRMIQGLETLWASANTENLAYLPYNPDGGAIPQRNAPAALNQAEIAQAAQAIDDIRATTGISEQAAQAPAITESATTSYLRAEAGTDATYAWLDNLRRSIEHTGRILVDMIPRIYDAPRMVRVLGEDMADNVVAINQPDPITGRTRNDLSAGTYDVTVSAGPAYATQRQQAANVLIQMMRIPEIAPVAAHMLAQTLDIPQGRQLAKMLKRALPPGLLDPDDKDVPQGPPQGPSPAEQAQMALVQAELIKAQAQAQKAQADAQATMAGIQGKTQGQELDNMQTALELAQADGSIEALVSARVQAALRRIMGNPNGM